MALPSGLLTFLFTDIEGSTRRWETAPEAMRAALAAHDEVLREAIENHQGALFKHTGDGVCAVFASAQGAIDAAVQAQRDLVLPVRLGIASGVAEVEHGDYFGQALNRTARVMAAGHGGQILVAASAADLVHGVDLVDLGEHRLRDLSDGTRLFQVRAAGLPQDFAPLKTVDAQPGNLPVQMTLFIGRRLEVKEVTELVRAHRLVTLTGVGGVGKTRLGLQAGAELVAEFPDGVWLVELAHVGDSAAVPDALAAALSITPQPGLTLSACIANALETRRALLVIDNCEHVIDAAAELVNVILSRSATVKVLATSRELLRLPAEHAWPVPPLDVTDGLDSAAVELFVDRAQAVNPGFVLVGASDTEAVTEICRRLASMASGGAALHG